jgi:hypothetical protein
MSQNNKNSNGRRPRRRRNEGYIAKSPAVCIVVHDPSGNPMPDKVAAEILNSINAVALDNGYLINFTRT